MYAQRYKFRDSCCVSSRRSFGRDRADDGYDRALKQLVAIVMLLVGAMFARSAYQEILFVSLVEKFYSERPYGRPVLIRGVFNESVTLNSKTIR